MRTAVLTPKTTTPIATYRAIFPTIALAKLAATSREVVAPSFANKNKTVGHSRNPMSSGRRSRCVRFVARGGSTDVEVADLPHRLPNAAL